jgi:hypothetical protein
MVLIGFSKIYKYRTVMRVNSLAASRDPARVQNAAPKLAIQKNTLLWALYPGIF